MSTQTADPMEMVARAINALGGATTSHGQLISRVLDHLEWMTDVMREKAERIDALQDRVKVLEGIVYKPGGAA